MKQETLYVADYLGALPEKQYRLVGSFLCHDGIEKTHSLLPYILEQSFNSQTLLQLEQVIRMAVGFDQFVMQYRSPRELPTPYYDQWSRYQGAVSETIGRELLESQLKDSEVIISNKTLIEEIARLTSSIRGLSVGDSSFNYKVCNGSIYSCPDAIKMIAEGGVGVVEGLFELKSTELGMDIDNSREQDRHTTRQFRDPYSQEVLIRALGKIVGAQPEDILLPGLEELQVNKVVTEAVPSKPSIISVGLPSARGFALFVLRIMNGSMDTQTNWESYFTPVKSNTATGISTIRGSGRSTYQRYRHAK